MGAFSKPMLSASCIFCSDSVSSKWTVFSVWYLDRKYLADELRARHRQR